MKVNIHVEKNNNESTANLIRRFTKRMKAAGIIQKVRSTRYFDREKSRNVGKSAKLRKLERQKEYERLYKLGKIPEMPTRSRGRR